MKLTVRTTLLAAALALPATFAAAQTQAPAGAAPGGVPHHPATGSDATTPALATPAAPATATTPAAPPANPQAQIAMMMGDLRQMMGMMQQMMGMMAGAQGGGPGAMMGGGRMGGGMPMAGMMPGPQAPDGPGFPGMFRHTEGILAFYRAELRITDAQAAPWNAFAEAVRAHVKNLREAMQRAAAQRATGTVPEQLDRRIALLTAQLDATKAVATAGKALYATLSQEQRKLADGFMADHLRGMRGMVP